MLSFGGVIFLAVLSMCSKSSCLGEPWCSDWGCCETAPPAAKRTRSRVDDEKENRFTAPHSPTTMRKICQGYIPPNTSKSTSWAVRVFQSWREQRNKSISELCPEKLLEEPTVENLNYWLSRFVIEVRREDGKPYPPASINNILAGLYRYSRSCLPTGVECPNFMNRKDACFRDLTGAVQVRYRELRTAGVGAVVKHAPVITPEEENMLWESRVIGVHTPLALLRAIFFYVGKTFCVRGGEEQRRLKRSQFKRSYNPDCYTYVENGSKNHSGVNFREENKVVPVFSCPEAQPRCLVYLLDTYFEKFPPRATELDLFYLRPKKSPRDGVWYDNVPIGRDKLKTFLEVICREAGIGEKKTNHSLRATGATALFNAGVPEKLIRDVTGHRSNALQLYERPSLQQRQEVSKVLVQGAEKTVQKENIFRKGNGPVNPPASCSSNVFGSIFSNVNNCTINITPQNFSVNVCSTSHATPDVDVDDLLKGIDIETFLT